MYIECMVITHFLLRPTYWWLGRKKWSNRKKIVVYLLVIYLCIWILLGADNILFKLISIPTTNFDWSTLSTAKLYLVVMITWALLFHYWVSKSNNEEDTPKENTKYYVACQMVGWIVVCGFWYVLYTGRGEGVDTQMAFFWPWAFMVYSSGILLSHFLLRPFGRHLISLDLGPITKILLSVAVVYICITWQSLSSLVWVVWSNIQIPEQTSQENIAGTVVFFLVFGMWLTLYLGWLNWQKNLNDSTRRLKLEASLKEAQISGLTQQLNPHFIFNALNSLRAMIIKDQYVARKMVTEISNMLRYTLYESDKDVVPLSQEIEIVKNYLAIELLRYESRVTVTWDIPDELLQTNVIPLCIQTLVENAIKHTINKYPDGIFIRIQAEAQGPTIRISVVNRGTISPSEHNGIGLKNTRDRLALIFGTDSTLTLRQQESELVAAVITIPRDVRIKPLGLEKNV